LGNANKKIMIDTNNFFRPFKVLPHRQQVQVRGPGESQQGREEEKSLKIKLSDRGVNAMITFSVLFANFRQKWRFS
jgi:hypothetical protein